MDEKIELIEKIDTSKIIRPNTKDIVAELINLQVKVNEVIDYINMYIMPDEPFDDDDEDGPTVVSPSNITLGAKNKNT